jgi:hypothetical protein
VLLPRRDDVGDVCLEGGETALVLGDLGVVYPHDRPMGGRAEPQEDPLAGPAAGHPHRGLVPGVADVIAHLGIGEDVVVAGRHGDLAYPR